MASERKPLFMQSPEGYHEEVATTDYMTIAKLTIPTSGSGGVGIVMNANKITGAGPATASGDVLVWGQNNAQLGSTGFTSNVDMGNNLINNLATPIAPDDAVNKAYVDALSQGLDPHSSCVVKTVSGLGTTANKAGATGGAVALPMAGETFDIQLHDPYGTTVTVTFTTEANLTAVAATINAAIQAVYGASYTVAFVNGSNIDLRDKWTGSKARVTVSNVTEGTPGDLVGKTGISVGTATGTGFTASGTGVGKTLTAPTDSATYNTIDGYTFAATGSAQRVLVASENGDETTPAIDNGIYTVTTLGDGAGTSLVLTRATDCDETSSTEFHQGVYVFIISGTVFIDTGWDCVTVDPITVDTTPNAWSQFSGAPTYTYDQGLIKIISSIQVDLDTVASEAGTGAAGGSSGLEFDVNTASGKLRAKVDPTKAIRRFANGLGIKLDGSTAALDVGGAGSGLSVAGVPNLFTVGGTATSQTPGTGQVTAANLNTLTAGSTSNADTLHTHTSLASTSAPILQAVMDATGGSVAIKDPVYITGTNNLVAKALASVDASARVIGISQANPSGSNFMIVYAGKAAGVVSGLSGAGAGVPVYLATTGGLSTALPGASNRVIQVGICLNADDLFVRITDYGKKAA
jgi:hypothetical protein